MLGGQPFLQVDWRYWPDVTLVMLVMHSMLAFGRVDFLILHHSCTWRSIVWNVYRLSEAYVENATSYAHLILITVMQNEWGIWWPEYLKCLAFWTVPLDQSSFQLLLVGTSCYHSNSWENARFFSKEKRRIESHYQVLFRCHFTLFFLFFSSDKTIEALACQFHEKPFPSSTLLIVYVLLISILHRQELQISSHVAFFLHLFRTSKHVRRQINYEEKQRAVSNNIFRVTGKLN